MRLIKSRPRPEEIEKLRCRLKDAEQDYAEWIAEQERGKENRH
jgi:hypothetical protein